MLQLTEGEKFIVFNDQLTFSLHQAIKVSAGSVISSKVSQASLSVNAIESESTLVHHCPFSAAPTSSVLSTECVSPTLKLELSVAKTADPPIYMLPDSSGTRPLNLKKFKITEYAILERLKRIDQEKAAVNIDDDTVFCVLVAHVISKLSVEQRRATPLRILGMLHEAQKNDMELPEEQRACL